MPSMRVGRPPQLVDTGADAQFNGGVHSGQTAAGGRVTATASSRPGLDATVAEGRSWALHIEADEAVNPIVSVAVAEHVAGRDI